VVVTAGDGGATAYFAQGSVTCEAHAVAVVDTVGAGDTFHAALLAHFNAQARLTIEALAELTRDQVAAALEFASAAAAVTCTRRGADLPSRADVDALLKGPRS
jgi:fructokinase